MDELRDAPTQPLDAFEATALTPSRDGTDLHVGNDSREVRFLGALRRLPGVSLRSTPGYHRSPLRGYKRRAYAAPFAGSPYYGSVILICASLRSFFTSSTRWSSV
jgi:hypothetical protein